MDPTTETTDLFARAAAILAALRELERVCEEATPGEWDAEPTDDYGNYEVCSGDGEPVSGFPVLRDDANFIAAARTALPVLVRIGIAEMERAQDLIALGAKARKHDGGPALTSLYFEADAEFILDRWSPLLAQPKEGEQESVGPEQEG